MVDNHEARNGVSCQEWNIGYCWSAKEKENYWVQVHIQEEGGFLLMVLPPSTKLG